MRRRVAGTRRSPPVGKRVSYDAVSCRDADVICLTGDVTATERHARSRTNKTTGWCPGLEAAGR